MINTPGARPKGTVNDEEEGGGGPPEGGPSSGGGGSPTGGPGAGGAGGGGVSPEVTEALDRAGIQATIDEATRTILQDMSEQAIDSARSSIGQMQQRLVEEAKKIKVPDAQAKKFAQTVAGQTFRQVHGNLGKLTAGQIGAIATQNGLDPAINSVVQATSDAMHQKARGLKATAEAAQGAGSAPSLEKLPYQAQIAVNMAQKDTGVARQAINEQMKQLQSALTSGSAAEMQQIHSALSGLTGSVRPLDTTVPVEELKRVIQTETQQVNSALGTLEHQPDVVSARSTNDPGAIRSAVNIAHEQKVLTQNAVVDTSKEIDRLSAPPEPIAPPPPAVEPPPSEPSPPVATPSELPPPEPPSPGVANAPTV
jgi:hypothetical protein